MLLQYIIRMDVPARHVNCLELRAGYRFLGANPDRVVRRTIGIPTENQRDKSIPAGKEAVILSL
jgi:hypothetical protein